MRVSVVPDVGRGAGHALIRVPAAAGASSPRFRIARPAGWSEPNLGPAGWQGAEAELEPLDASPEGPDLLLAVGPRVCGWLEEGTFMFSLPAANLSVPIAWPEIEEVHGGSGTTFDARPEPAAAVAAVPQARADGPPPPAPANPGGGGTGVGMGAGTGVPIVAEATEKAARRSNAPVAAAMLGLVALALAGGGAWWWWQHRAVSEPAPAPPAAAEPPAPPPAPAAAPPAPPSAPVPPPPDPDTLSVADLVGRGNVADMLNQARKRLPTRPEDSLLLLEAAGDDRHDGAALTELGRLYDPNRPRQGIPADARQAAKYYRAANRANDESGKEERDALRRTLQARRDAGDLSAKLIEQDYWP